MMAAYARTTSHSFGHVSEAAGSGVGAGEAMGRLYQLSASWTTSDAALAAPAMLLSGALGSTLAITGSNSCYNSRNGLELRVQR